MKPIDVLLELRNREQEGSGIKPTIANQCYAAFIRGFLTEDEAVCAYMKGINEVAEHNINEHLRLLKLHPDPIEVNGVKWIFNPQKN